MESTIRIATEDDAPLIRKLCSDCEVTNDPGKRFVLVLDAPQGGIAAAAVVNLEQPRGHLSALAIAPGHEGERLEDRLIAVAGALCEAYGCDTLDIPRSFRRAAA